jgi:hypothetical protein
MKPKDVKKFYKTGYRFRKQTGMSDNTLKNWIDCGYVPFKSQKKIEAITNGILVAEWDDNEPFFSSIKPKEQKDKKTK